MQATEPAKIEEFIKRIIEWYRLHGDIHLPWRSAKSGWEVLVASILLRKTTTKQVAEIYMEFTRRYPGPQALLKASEEEVRELIKPLGIEHQRSKQLIALAREIVERFGGQVPCDEKSLKELPGVGDYVASEILLVACNQPEPLLDRNMIRILERVFGVKSLKKRPHTDKALWRFAKTIVPAEPGQARKFNYGVLDFARKICTARSPKCPACPLRDICFFYAAGRSNP